MVTVGLLDRYMWRQVRGLFAFGVAVFTILLLINHLFYLARLVLQQGASLLAAFELLVYRLPYFLAFSFPMAVLLAVLMGMGRLSDAQEITAMRTSGISLARIAIPVIAVGFLVSAATLVTNEGLVPLADDRYRAALLRVIGAPQKVQQEDVLFREEQDGLESVYFVRRFYPDPGRMEGVVVNQLEHGRLQRVIEARSGRYGDEGWEFSDGTLYLFSGPTTIATRFERLRVALRRTPREIAIPQKEPSEMSYRELRAYIGVLKRSGTNAARYAVELQTKLAFPVSAMLFALLAVPLGLRPHRSGPSVGLGLTVLVMVAYYLMISVTMTLGQGGRLHPLLAAWLPNLALAAAGIVLLRRADR